MRIAKRLPAIRRESAKRPFGIIRRPFPAGATNQDEQGASSMSKDVVMPALGMAQETGTLIRWLKEPGQSVAKGEPLMEIETDKATVEIEAPAAGILANVTAHPGAIVPV